MYTYYAHRTMYGKVPVQYRTYLTLLYCTTTVQVPVPYLTGKVQYGTYLPYNYRYRYSRYCTNLYGTGTVPYRTLPTLPTYPLTYIRCTNGGERSLSPPRLAPRTAGNDPDPPFAFSAGTGPHLGSKPSGLGPNTEYSIAPAVTVCTPVPYGMVNPMVNNDRTRGRRVRSK